MITATHLGDDLQLLALAVLRLGDGSFQALQDLGLEFLGSISTGSTSRGVQNLQMRW
jgi:hypothetical protein